MNVNPAHKWLHRTDFNDRGNSLFKIGTIILVMRLLKI